MGAAIAKRFALTLYQNSLPPNQQGADLERDFWRIIYQGKPKTL